MNFPVSPDPARRRCRKCHLVDRNLIAMGELKMSGPLWYWYHEICVPADTPFRTVGEMINL